MEEVIRVSGGRTMEKPMVMEEYFITVLIGTYHHAFANDMLDPIASHYFPGSWAHRQPMYGVYTFVEGSDEQYVRVRLKQPALVATFEGMK